MGGTYAGAYSDYTYPLSNTSEKKSIEVYTVLSAKHIDTYHFHGSLFEYTWELKLLDQFGNTDTRKMDTWVDYRQLAGKKINYDGNVFRLQR